MDVFLAHTTTQVRRFCQNCIYPNYNRGRIEIFLGYNSPHDYCTYQYFTLKKGVM